MARIRSTHTSLYFRDFCTGGAFLTSVSRDGFDRRRTTGNPIAGGGAFQVLFPPPSCTHAASAGLSLNFLFPQRLGLLTAQERKEMTFERARTKKTREIWRSRLESWKSTFLSSVDAAQIPPFFPLPLFHKVDEITSPTPLECVAT